MTYLENLKLEAAKTVEGLAANVVELEKQVVKIEDRILYARDDLARIDGTIADFKAKSAEKLTASTSAYAEWQGRLRRLTQEWNSAKEALALLEAQIAPKTKAARGVARKELSQALTGLCLAGRPRCSARMAELLDVVVGEHDAYLAACERLHQDYGLTFTPPDFDHGVVVEHARLSHVRKHLLTSPMHYLAFTDPPAPAEAVQAAPGAPISIPPGTFALPGGDRREKGHYATHWRDSWTCWHGPRRGHLAAGPGRPGLRRRGRGRSSRTER